MQLTRCSASCTENHSLCVEQALRTKAAVAARTKRKSRNRSRQVPARGLHRLLNIESSQDASVRAATRTRTREKRRERGDAGGGRGLVPLPRRRLHPIAVTQPPLRIIIALTINNNTGDDEQLEIKYTPSITIHTYICFFFFLFFFVLYASGGRLLLSDWNCIARRSARNKESECGSDRVVADHARCSPRRLMTAHKTNAVMIPPSKKTPTAMTAVTETLRALVKGAGSTFPSSSPRPLPVGGGQSGNKHSNEGTL